MRRLASFAVLVVGAYLRVCHARQPGFSIHHDLLAYPQFEVVFSDTYISEDDARALLDKPDAAHPAYDAGLASQTDIAPTIRAATADNDDQHAAAASAAATESYEVMSMPPHRYLCAIPVIEPPPAPNKTATELAKAELARELARASAHGWDLINQLDGKCLYYMSGWWSYRFCYGQDVVQFHAVPSSVKSGPPMRDLTTAEYVLGRVPDPHVASRHARRTQNQQRAGNTQQPRAADADANAVAPAPPNTDLQVKGDQRYLVQKMGDGTICDLTGRERTIEIQYHCSPDSTQDRIGWIKEVTTCSYLMLVNTPRLCVDVAFQPPKEERANIISCRAIVSEAGQADWHARKTLEAQAAMVGRAKEAAAKAPIVIGGVVVGGRHMLGKGEDGKEAPNLAPPKNFRSDSAAGARVGGREKLVEIIASATGKDEGGEVSVMSEEQLQELDLSPEVIEEFQREIQKLAGDRGWQLKMVEFPGNNRELVGVIEDGDEDDLLDDEERADAKEKKKKKEKTAGKNEEKGFERAAKGGDGDGDGDGGDEGSEEVFYKEEL